MAWDSGWAQAVAAFGTIGLSLILTWAQGMDRQKKDAILRAASEASQNAKIAELERQTVETSRKVEGITSLSRDLAVLSERVNGKLSLTDEKLTNVTHDVKNIQGSLVKITDYIIGQATAKKP